MRACLTSRLATVLLCLTAVAAAPRQTDAGDSVDRMLAGEVPKLLQQLRSSGANSVAVLPFRLRHPDAEASLKGAVIQTNFAVKLERALATFYNRREPVRVVFDAWSQVLRQDRRASFATTQDRKKLFDQRFELPVKSPPIQVDALVTGIIQPSDDYRTTTISFELCTRDQPERWKRPQPPVVIETDRSVLVGMGRGFSVPRRRVATRSVTEDDVMESVSEDAQWAQERDADYGIASASDRVNVTFEQPLADFPVQLKILYDKQPQPVQFDTIGGRFNGTVKDPQAGQRVTFEIENKRNETLAIILSVNGQNTLYGGDATDLSAAAQWVLQPRQAYAVRGIYGEDRKTLVPLRGLSDAETDAFVRGGYVNPELAGLIALHVFREAPTPALVDQQANSELTLDGEVAGKQPLQPVNSIAGDNQTPRQDLDTSFGGDTSELTGFNLGLVRGLQTGGSFHPRETANTAPSWSKLKDKLFITATRAGESRGLMIASGPQEQVEVKTREMGQTELIASAMIRYLSVARPELSSPLARE